MISNTDSTLLVYSPEHMRVKVYTGRAQATVSVGVRHLTSLASDTCIDNAAIVPNHGNLRPQRKNFQGGIHTTAEEDADGRQECGN